MEIGLIIVGDEILSGKRQDKHFAKVLELLQARGLAMAWAQYIGDDRARLAAVLRRTFASDEVVLCCGGIGATPDDHTRQAAAMALGRPLIRHPQAVSLIAGRVAEMAAEGKAPADMAAPENQQRLQMAEFPEGAALVPNPVNRIPGFSIAQHWFVPGFPVMAWPMMEWVLDTHYRPFFHRERLCERSMLVAGVYESQVAPLLVAIEQSFPGVKVYSLPSMGADGAHRHLELGLKGASEILEPAWIKLCEGVAGLGGTVIG